MTNQYRECGFRYEDPDGVVWLCELQPNHEGIPHKVWIFTDHPKIIPFPEDERGKVQMKTKVQFFNAHPPHTIITQEAVSPWVGKTVPISRDGQVIGHGVITAATSTNEGVIIEYETLINLGIQIEL